MTVKHALLGLLAEKPRHGYELHAAFEALSGGNRFWELKLAQVYATLERLREAGFVECTSDLGEGEAPDRRVYALTPAGMDALNSWYVRGITGEHERDEFYIKLMVAISTGYGEPYRILSAQRAYTYQRLHQVTHRRNALNAQVELAQVLLLDKAIMYLEADLRWLDMIESRLDDIKRQPRPKPELKSRGRPRKLPREEKEQTYE
jgi:DNA-binding PadR family transcriptional regulator